MLQLGLKLGLVLMEGSVVSGRWRTYTAFGRAWRFWGYEGKIFEVTSKGYTVADMLVAGT